MSKKKNIVYLRYITILHFFDHFICSRLDVEFLLIDIYAILLAILDGYDSIYSLSFFTLTILTSYLTLMILLVRSMVRVTSLFVSDNTTDSMLSNNIERNIILYFTIIILIVLTLLLLVLVLVVVLVAKG